MKMEKNSPDPSRRQFQLKHFILSFAFLDNVEDFLLFTTLLNNCIFFFRKFTALIYFIFLSNQ